MDRIICPGQPFKRSKSKRREPCSRGYIEFNCLLDLFDAFDGVGSTLIITYSILFKLIFTDFYLAEVFVKPYNSEIASKMEVALSESIFI